MQKQTKNSKKLFLSGLCVFAVAVLVFLGGYWCPFRFMTGIPCPGCGITRAFLALIRGDFAGAVEHNVAILMIVPLVMYLAVLWIVRRKRPSMNERWVWWPTMAVVVLMLALWCVRLFV